MFLKAGTDFRASHLFQVIPEFCQKLSAAEHRDSSSARERSGAQDFPATSSVRAASEPWLQEYSTPMQPLPLLSKLGLCHARARRSDISPATAEPLPLQAASFQMRPRPARDYPPSSESAGDEIRRPPRLDPGTQTACVAEAAQSQYW